MDLNDEAKRYNHEHRFFSTIHVEIHYHLEIAKGILENVQYSYDNSLKNYEKYEPFELVRTNFTWQSRMLYFFNEIRSFFFFKSIRRADTILEIYFQTPWRKTKETTAPINAKMQMREKR